MTYEIYVYDTCALIELLKKNPNYEKFADENPVINNFIYAEFCYNLLKDNIKNYKEYLEEVKKAIVSLEPAWIEEAMIFRYKNKKKKLSITDCISYITAQKLGIKFLTGDKVFEKLDGVEFVR